MAEVFDSMETVKIEFIHYNPSSVTHRWEPDRTDVLGNDHVNFLVKSLSQVQL